MIALVPAVALSAPQNDITPSWNDTVVGPSLPFEASLSAPETLITESFIYVPELPEYNLPIASRSRNITRSLGYNPWSCVSYVKFKRPDQTAPWGTPNKVKVYDITPAPGLLVITTEGPVGHTAYIESVASGSMIVSEANFIPGVVSTRSISIDDPVIRGFR